MYFDTCYSLPDTGIEDLEKIECSLSRLALREFGNKILAVDFNLGNINWEIPAFLPEDAALQTALLNISADVSLSLR